VRGESRSLDDFPIRHHGAVEHLQSDAVTELQGTATLRVHFTDAQKPAVVFTLQNDFCDQAILVVNDSDIPQ